MLFVTAALTLLSAAAVASAASLQTITGFGSNPTGLTFQLYVPDKVASKPPVLLVLHYCGGTGAGYFGQTPWKSYADKYGFVAIYPTATRSEKCWDVASDSSLKHNGGGDSTTLITMINWVISNKNGDASRVYVTGESSGAMMTNVMLATYPDVFKAGVAFAGVPYYCFHTNGGLWNSDCAGGKIIKTGAQWGDLVRNAYPGYSGPRPRMQVWHGTSDATLNYQNFLEEIKEWTNVLGLSETATKTDTSVSPWTHKYYGSSNNGFYQFESISAQGVGHGVATSAVFPYALTFLGLDTNVTPTNPTTTTTKTTTKSTTTNPVTTSKATTVTTTIKTTTTSVPTGSCAAKWAQCGGNGWTGSTCCASGSTCTFSNNWYSQCL